MIWDIISFLIMIIKNRMSEDITMIGDIITPFLIMIMKYRMSSDRHTSPPDILKENNPNSSVARKRKISRPNFNYLNRRNIFNLIQPESVTFVYGKSYVICYDHRTKIPKYVIETLSATNKQCDDGPFCKKKQFEEDSSVPEFYRSLLSDYKDSNYGRGHMARADNYSHDKEDWNSTYLLSNIVPQDDSFNSGIWNRLEQHVVNFVNLYDTVHVWSGTLFKPKKGTSHVSYKIIGNNVAVPTHFFKVILGITEDGQGVMESYLLEHENIAKEKSLENFMVDKAEIEKYAGYRIFEDFPYSMLKRINFKKIKSQSKL